MTLPIPARLANKLNLLVIFLVLLTAVSIATLISQRGIRADRAELLELGVSLAELGSRQSEFALYTQDPAAMRTVLDNLASNSSIGFVVLLDRNGKALQSKAAKDVPSPVPPPDTGLFGDDTRHTEIRIGAGRDPYFDIVAPVRSRSDSADLFPDMEPAAKPTLGYVRIGVRQDSLKDKTREIVLSTLILTALVVTLGVTATVLITRRILRPVESLVQATHQISRGNLVDHVDAQASGEIGELAASFNEMLDRLRDYRQRVDEAQATLEARVEDRTRELQRATEEARNSARAALEASRAKSQFLATMSHEIRTPMNGVLGMTDLLRGTPLNERQRRFVEAVYHSGQSLLRIINDILDFSKIEAGKIELEQIDFDLRELVEDVCSMFAQPAHSKGLEIACLLPHTVPVAIRGDPVRLRQVITNIVGNAVKFTSAGEVSVRVHKVEETAERARLRFEVRDTGPGIAEDKQERIFEAFSQADNSTTRSYGGTGLGLAISKQLVELMGGHMSVSSRPGQGATFAFDIEALKQSSGARSRFADPDRLAGLRILVVDDNATNREILAEQMSAWSIRCATCGGAREALELLRAARERGDAFDLAVLDLHMPEIDGVELARTIKSEPELAAMPLIMLSSATMIDGTEALARGLIRCSLTKPVRQLDLFHAIATANGDAAEALEPIAAAEQPAPGVALSGIAPSGIATAHAAASCRVLLAEDNAINQEVARAMLENLGVAVTIVSDGSQVLPAVAAETFDLILMDCQMPVMDGYEATARVREHEHGGDPGRRIPIVALTANAVAGDAEQCLAAGMDDYLSKPFTQKELAAVIARWVPASGASAPPARAQDAANAPVAADTGAVMRNEAVNARALEAIRSLAPGLLEKVIGQYLDDAPRYIEQIRAAVSASDAEALRRAAHALKSSSANMGAEGFAALCQSLETLGRAGTTGGAAARFADAEREFARVRESLQAQLSIAPS